MVWTDCQREGSAVQEVNQRVHEIMQHHLQQATTPNLPLTPASPAGLLGVCATLRVLATLEAFAPEYVARFTSLLVKLLNRVARDHASPGGLVLDPRSQLLGRSPRCVLLPPFPFFLFAFVRPSTHASHEQMSRVQLLPK